MKPKTLPSTELDPITLQQFLNQDNLSFRHLDWVQPSDLILEKGCFALEENGLINAVLSCQPENNQAAWIRFYLCTRNGKHRQNFCLLLEKAFSYLKEMQVPAFYALATQPWMESLLISNNFQLDNQVVTLFRETEFALEDISCQNLTIRTMTARDLASVLGVDGSSFAPAWQLNARSLENSYQLSSHSSVALLEGKLVGYQITTSTFNTAHLARLAVLPEFQQQHIGSALVHKLISDCESMGISEITVNTQADNHASLKLYQNLGFTFRGETLPVYICELI